MTEIFETEIKEAVKKSDLCAKEPRDFEKLKDMQAQFLRCEIKEEKEAVSFFYDIKNKSSYQELRGEKRVNQLRTLLEIKDMEELFKEYWFSLSPENLYYDRNYRSYIKRRDLYEKGIAGDCQDFMEQYKALIAHVIQKKYDFEDYYVGGADLYKKNSFLKKMDEKKSLREIVDFLREEYEKEKEITLHKKVEVPKAWYRLNTWCLLTSVVLLVAAGIYIIYAAFVLLPRKNSMLDASNSYLEGKYVKVIEDMQDIDLKYMDKYLKYILAVSYVRSESLAPEQKENILETLSINGEEKQKDYWIYLGRLDTAEAQNLAMQCSDDELLLYAYITEKAIVEKDTKVSGEEKAQALADLEKKIEELAKKYGQTDEDN